MIAIEHGVPLPEAKSRKFPFHQMEIGDSFKVSRELRVNVTNQARYWKIKISIRVEDAENIRVWRVS